MYVLYAMALRKNNFHMKKILVPVDFTDISKYGTELAVKTAAQLNAEIHFLSIITLPSHILLTPEGDIFEDGDFDTSIPKKLKAESEVKMQAWKEKYFTKAISCICYGRINEQILEYVKKHQVDLIVMGTHASSGMKELLNASHAEYVAMHTNVPLLSLKCDRSDMQVKRIVLAASFKNGDVPHSEMAIELQKAFNARLYLLRINTPGDLMPDGEVEKNMRTYAEKHQLTNYETAVYNDKDVEDGIIHFVSKQDIDIIAIGSMQRTGLNKIINGCVSADLVNHVYKPILTFKLKD